MSSRSSSTLSSRGGVGAQRQRRRRDQNLPRDLRLVYTMLIDRLLLVDVGHTWPFILVVEDTDNRNGVLLYAYNPMIFMPNQATGDFYAINPARIYNTFRMITFSFGMRLH